MHNILIRHGRNQTVNNLITLLAAGALAASATVAEAETKLTYGSWAPATHPNSLAFENFAETVSKATEGEVTFEASYDGSVVQWRTALSSVRDLVVDAAAIPGVFSPELPIDAMITNYAAINSNQYALSGAVTELVLNECESCRAEVAANGVVPLAYTGDPHFYLMCRKPISSLDDLKGKSVRAASAFQRFVNHIGGTPVSTPTVEVLEVMQRGQVECVVGGAFWLRTYSLWDVVEFVVDMPLGQYNNGLTLGVNSQVWENIGADGQEAILKALPVLIETSGDEYTKLVDDVRAESKAHGVAWVEPTQEMVESFKAWQATERASVEAWAAEKGIEGAPPILNAFEALVTKWNALSAADDKQQYREALEAIYK